jgi:hypothetical protein
MDERIAIWNVLHDGEITVVSEEGDRLTMFVSIPYLRRELKPLGDSFVLTLSGVRRAEFRPRDISGRAATAVSLPEELERATVTILKTESMFLPVMIETTTGRLLLDFEEIGFALDNGHRIDYLTIKNLSDVYWTEWKAQREAGAWV